MNWDEVQGNWKEWKGKAQQKWGEITDDELDEAAGDRTELEGLIQQKYGKSKQEAKEAVDSWLAA